MHTALRLVLCCLALFACGCAARQPDAAQPGTQNASQSYGRGQLVLPDGTPAQDRAVANLLRGADYIILGERHDSAVDHIAQARVLRLLADSGQKTALGLEMLPRNTFAPELEKYLSGALSISQLPEAVRWSTNWGYDFKLYQPIFAEARRQAMPIAGLNIPQDIRATVSKKGLKGLTPKQKAALPAKIHDAPEEHKTALASTFLMHAAMRVKAGGRQTGAGSKERLVLPVPVTGAKKGQSATVNLPISLKKPFERFLLVQNLWDSTMAEEAAALHAKSGLPVVLAAGAGHSQKGRGIAYRLPFFDPKARIIHVMPFSGTAPDAKQADLFYYSPPEGHSRYGFVFTAANGTFSVKEVIPGSKAAKAGILAGDIIAKAGGLPVRSGSDLHRAAFAARTTGKVLELVVRRGSKDVTVRLP
ncbi:ChaN family lipoprotein [Desulfovibrio sp. OttesenSCG-928-G15]|nr:ChaN family lipoprotein [Desulfovibrio sp. OttesenSCG-928-G15]